MQAPNKKSLIAAAAAPFALTLALGAAPAYAEGNGNQNQSGQPNASATENTSTKSTTWIEVAGCEVTSGKENSYIQYLDDGMQVDKDESIDSESATLRTDIEYTSVTVKAGTTVETRETDCSTPKEQQGEESPVVDTPESEESPELEKSPEVEESTEPKNDNGNESQENVNDSEDTNENVGGSRDNENNNRGNDDVAGAEANAGADVRGNASVEVRGNATTSTPQGDADVVLGAEGETQAYQPTAADGSTQYLPNTGAEESAALIAGGAGLAGFGAWMMLKRRRFGLER